MKRLDFHPLDGGFTELEDGEYVRYEDHLAAMADERRQSEECWHEARMILTPASGNAYLGMVEAARVVVQERDDYKADYYRVHKDKMDLYEANVSLRSYAVELREAAEGMVNAFRSWMAGCDQNVRYDDVHDAHIALRDALAKCPEICAQPESQKDEGHSDPLGEYAMDLEQALFDLVELKRIKERIEAGTAGQVERDYYQGQKEAAWQAARETLEARPAECVHQVGHIDVETVLRAADPLRIIVEDLAQGITPTDEWRKAVLAEWRKVTTRPAINSHASDEGHQP